MSSSHARQPAGIPAGGQFATTARPEAAVTLGQPSDARADAAITQLQDAAGALGAAEAELVRAAQVTGMRAWFTDPIGRASGVRADAANLHEAALKAAARLAGNDTAVATSALTRAAAFRAAVGPLPDEGTARAALEAAELDVDRWQTELDGAGYYDLYDTTPKAQGKLIAARARRDAAQLLVDAVTR